MIKNKEQNFISAIIYIRNNENMIIEFLSTLYNILSENFEKFEVICVNDNSSDNSINLVKKFRSENQDGMLAIVNMSYYQGLELSMKAGIDLAIGDFVFEFDSISMDYNDDLILQVYKKALTGFDIVTVKRNETKLISNLFYAFFEKNAKMQHGLNSEKFRIISRRGINRVYSMNKVMSYRKAVYASCGLKIFTFTYEANKREYNKYEKNQFFIHTETAVNSLMLFTDFAYKVALFVAILMMVVTISIALYVTVLFVLNVSIEGYTTTMLLISGSFFGVFVLLAIIIKYLSLILNLVFKRQQYLVESIEKITD